MAAVLLVLVMVTVYAHAQDSQLVGSSVQEQRVRAPQDLLAAGTGDHAHRGKDDQGYRRTHSSKGGNGYKNFDSFHKKDGDSFGYEKHDAFGDGDHGSDGGEYYESSSYDSGDGGRSKKPKMTSYHYESKSGTPRDDSYDPETYEGDYSELTPRKVKPESESKGTSYQSLPDKSKGKPPAGRRRMRPRTKERAKEPQTAGTEADAEYDYYYDSGEGDGDDGSSEAAYYSEDGDYEGGDY